MVRVCDGPSCESRAFVHVETTGEYGYQEVKVWDLCMTHLNELYYRGGNTWGFKNRLEPLTSQDY